VGLAHQRGVELTSLRAGAEPGCVEGSGFVDWSIGNLIWIVLGGAIVGFLARLILPGRQNIPWWSVIGAGIVGMLAGDWLAGILGVEDTGGFDWIRHGLQLAVGAGAVGVVAALMGRPRSSS
jgi:uncharacterized membrane protein YeaQ/YmgE (transglycosylase-associated protein family)